MAVRELQTKQLPQALPLSKLIGPSFIILGLGLGSGEVVLWPSLASKFGMGIIWGALLGLTFQFFMNMEIERYALAKGESVFVGLYRKFKLLPYWFLLSTFIPWAWPGIAASSATLFGSVFGITNIKLFSIILLIIMGLILSLGPILYKTVETLQKILISIGVPSIFILSIVLAKQHHWQDLAAGIVGQGNNYFLLPAEISIASFLAALAYAGAGGNLNLAQSLYIKEKGYGMGKYAGKIKSLITGGGANRNAGEFGEELSLSGNKFDITPANISIFNQWWKNINKEHFLVFWFTGSITILLLALLSYVTTYNSDQNISGINFVIAEAKTIGTIIGSGVGIFFLIITGMTLFGTQLTVFDATSRILTENLILTFTKFNGKNVAKVYYCVLWLQILAGISVLLLGFTEPLQLIITAAVLNAFAMFVHTGLTLWLNNTSLEKEIRPNLFRNVAMSLAFLFYGGFSIFTIVDRLF
ncbi:Nramp family divalent metal transporter [candidate division WWE3 bacterium]|nr:Nramp family divalent metal transporter [candidate division WWE3 bacterium]